MFVSVEKFALSIRVTADLMCYAVLQLTFYQLQKILTISVNPPDNHYQAR
jgi:hypothetical protein